ncbi:MAG: hypothetical protein PHQ86_06000 [Dehalococcoidales bacterium]|nr:hypothetical protein [Dehalococcoidales bacterium]
MMIYIGLAVVSISLIHCGGTWAYVFFNIWQKGKVTFCEPNTFCVIVEFGIAVVLTLLGFFFLGVAIREMKRKTIEK